MVNVAIDIGDSHGQETREDIIMAASLDEQLVSEKRMDELKTILS